MGSINQVFFQLLSLHSQNEWICHSTQVKCLHRIHPRGRECTSFFLSGNTLIKAFTQIHGEYIYIYIFSPKKQLIGATKEEGQDLGKGQNKSRCIGGRTWLFQIILAYLQSLWKQSLNHELWLLWRLMRAGWGVRRLNKNKEKIRNCRLLHFWKKKWWK